MKKLLTFSPEQLEVLQKAAIRAGYARYAKTRVYGVEAYIHALIAQCLTNYPESDRQRKRHWPPKRD